MTITITGSNDVASLSSGSSALVEGDGSLQTSGALVLVDLDGTAASVVAKSGVAGSYGSFSIDGSGQWSYATNGAQNQLNAGQVVSDVFAVSTSDGGSATVTITITGTNDVPVITNGLAALAGTVIEAGSSDDGVVVAGTASITGSLLAIDGDGSATKAWTIVGSPSTSYGRIAIDSATGVWTYRLDNSVAATQALKEGETVTQSYLARVTDDFGASVDQTITVTIQGSNDLPLLGSGNLRTGITELNEGNASENNYTHIRTGSIGFSDPDGSDSQMVMVAQGGSNYRGIFTPSILSGVDGKEASVAWTFSVADADLDGLDAGQVISQTYQLKLMDGAGGLSNTQVVTVTLAGSGDVPVAARFEVRQGEQINGILPANLLPAGAGTGPLTYSLAALQVGSVSYPVPPWLSINASTGRLSGSPPATAVGEQTLALVATDAVGGRTTANVTIVVSNVNDAPSVTAAARSSITTDEDVPLQFDVSSWFNDADLDLLDNTGALLDGLTYGLENSGGGVASASNWFRIDPTSGVTQLSATNNEVGQRALQVKATDRNGVSAYVTTVVSVRNSNDAPELNATAAASFSRRVLAEDSLFRLEIPTDLFSDPDQLHNPAERIQLSVLQADGSALPQGWQFDAASGVISGSSVGLLANNLLIGAKDSSLASASSSHTLNLAVNRLASSPLISLLNSSPQVLEGGVLRLSDSFGVSNADPDSEQLTFLLEASGGPSLELVRLDSSSHPLGVVAATRSGHWELSSLDGLGLRTTNPDLAGSISLIVSATSTETLGGASATTSSSFNASFIPVADAPGWVLSNAGTTSWPDPLARPQLGTALTAQLQDQDGSESLRYRLSWADSVNNLSVTDPSGKVLGISGHQQVLLSAAEWAQAILVQEGGDGSPIDLSVVAIATENANADSREGDSKLIRWAATPQLSPGPFAITPLLSQINRYEGGEASARQRSPLELDLAIPAGARSVQLEFTLPEGSSVLDGNRVSQTSPGLNGSATVILSYDVAATLGQAKPWEHLSVVAPEGFKGPWQASVRLLSSARTLASDPFGRASFAEDLSRRLAVVSGAVDLTLSVLAQARQPDLAASYDPATQQLRITLQRGHSLAGAFDGQEALALVVRGVPDGMVLVDASNKPVGATDAYGTTVLINREAVAADRASQAETLDLFLIRRGTASGDGAASGEGSAPLTGSLSLALTALLPEEQQGGDSRSAASEVQVLLAGSSSIRELTAIDPLMLDLDGDGLALTNLQASSVSFDMLGLGLPFPTAWLSPEGSGKDAFLVVDRNGDGLIRSISELLSEYFGSSDGRRTAASGLEALGRFDSNADGRVDSADGAWSSLQLWFDDGDGRSEAGELVPLASRLTSISLWLGSPLSQVVVEQPAWAAGNQILRSAAATTTATATPTATPTTTATPTATPAAPARISSGKGASLWRRSAATALAPARKPVLRSRCGPWCGPSTTAP